jgi:hypothetical protein
MTGVELIAAERKRQIAVEGWTADHDDKHDRADLVRAALQYAETVRKQLLGASKEHAFYRSISYWPWDESWWKPSDDPIRNLEKAGALIAAEIDRLQRVAAGQYGVLSFDPNTGCRPLSDMNKDGTIKPEAQ